MKRVVVSVVLAVMAVCGYGQGHVEGYVGWDSLRPDAVKYLHLNFVQNQSRYVGRKMSVLFNDIELPFEWRVLAAIFFDGCDYEKFPEDQAYCAIKLHIEDPYYEDKMMSYIVWHDQDPDMVKPERYYGLLVEYPRRGDNPRCAPSARACPDVYAV